MQFYNKWLRVSKTSIYKSTPSISHVIFFSGNDHSEERHPMLTENVQRGDRTVGDCGMPEPREEPRSALFLHRQMEECKSIFYCYIFL